MAADSDGDGGAVPTIQPADESAFVESCGQVAVQGTSFSAGVDAVLRQRTASLTRAGWSTQSAWLNAPTQLR
jgi:hypothetical protein